MQSRDQTYAAKIFEQVSEVKESQSWTESKRKEYGSMAHKLPVLIRTAGLAQALAFVEARHKSESPQHVLLGHLCEAINAPGLVEDSRTVSLSEYMRLTHEAMAALLWYKRFAQSVLGVDASEAREGEQGEDEAAVEHGTEGEGA